MTDLFETIVPFGAISYYGRSLPRSNLRSPDPHRVEEASITDIILRTTKPQNTGFVFNFVLVGRAHPLSNFNHIRKLRATWTLTKNELSFRTDLL